MACGTCGGYYQCVCDEHKLEEEIRVKRLEADSLELKLIRLRESRKKEKEDA